MYVNVLSFLHEINTRTVISASFRCRYDWVEVASINLTSGVIGRSYGKFCGTTPPQPFSILGSIRIRFVTDEEVTDRGWIANYIVRG